ncbi:hypothetical protein CVT26_007518, partial [Gymnopilus dilepis]
SATAEKTTSASSAAPTRGSVRGVLSAGPRYIKSYPRGSEMRKLRAYVPTTSVVLRGRGNGLPRRTKLYHTPTHKAWQKGYSEVADEEKATWVAERVEEGKRGKQHIAVCKEWHKSTNPTWFQRSIPSSWFVSCELPCIIALY